jgi:hypothetical protein
MSCAIGFAMRPEAIWLDANWVFRAFVADLIGALTADDEEIKQELLMASAFGGFGLDTMEPKRRQRLASLMQSVAHAIANGSYVSGVRKGVDDRRDEEVYRYKVGKLAEMIDREWRDDRIVNPDITVISFSDSADSRWSCDDKWIARVIRTDLENGFHNEEMRKMFVEAWNHGDSLNVLALEPKLRNDCVSVMQSVVHRVLDGDSDSEVYRLSKNGETHELYKRAVTELADVIDREWAKINKST